MSENSENNLQAFDSNKVENSLEIVLNKQDKVGNQNSELAPNRLTLPYHHIITNTTENNMNDFIDDPSTLNYLAGIDDTNDHILRKNDDTIDTANVGQQQDDGKIKKNCSFILAKTVTLNPGTLAKSNI